MNDPNTAETTTSQVDSLADVPVALIGLGGLFPQSRDLREFWGNVVDAADCMQDVPESHWRISDHYDPDPSASDKTYAKRGGFVPTIPFNPMEFGLPPNTLEVTDVLQLLSLVVAKQTLADARVTDASWYDPSRTGVVLGITGANALSQPLSARLQTPVLKEVVRSCGLSAHDAEQVAAKFTAAFAPWEENSFPGMLGNVVAGRIANRFDFGGTNFTVDAACASSLAAVRMAVSELASRRADLMLTGGCDAENTILMYLCFSKTPAFSRSGRIRPFDESSDGTLIGEGIGMLALKRLADAERDGDRIYGVLRGIGSSSDGRFKSIYAPRQEGQEVALRRAYADAKIGPDTVGLMECHGTGTAVGDLVELSALREVYSAASEEKQFCAVGSIKSQIGHTKGAAGAAGLIKIALALHQKVLPPTINVDHPREAVDFPNSPFYVNVESRPWIVDAARPVRRAALSSFGFGGTNFHCVLEEHVASSGGTLALHRVNRVHVWHAADSADLLSTVDQHPAGMADSESVPAEHARLAVVARDEPELESRRAAAVERLKSELDVAAFEQHGMYYAARARAGGRIGAVFAGQGSQYVGMGAAAAMGTPVVRAELDEMSVAFGESGSLAKAVFPPPAFDKQTRDAQEAHLRGTGYAQPAIGALSAGQFRFLRELGLRIDGAVGHSFGELTALWASGALDDESFRTLAVTRGAVMAALPDGESDRGSMAAVRAAPEELTELLAKHTDVVVCNLNAADQTVVGGGTVAVGEFVEEVKAVGIGAQLLPVAAAFHTRYVAHAVEAFAPVVSSVDLRVPGIAVYPNTEGARYGADVDQNRVVLVEQLVNPVSFAPRLRQMYDEGFRTFVEFGPKSVLSGLVRRVLADADEDITVLPADSPSDGDFGLKQLVAQLVVHGCPLTELNRYIAPAFIRDDQKGMRIPLNGANYVPEERRRKYRDMLENGYRIRTPERAEPTPDGNASETTKATAEVNMHGASSTQPDGPSSASLSGAAAHEHLSLHREYLSSQLRVVERLSNVLAQHSEHGVPSDSVVSGIRAVSEHGVAIGQSHMQASEMLRAFAYLDAGAPMPADGGQTPQFGNGSQSPSPAPSRGEIAAGHTGAGDEVVLGETVGSANGDSHSVLPEAPVTTTEPITPAERAPTEQVEPSEPETAAGSVRDVLLGIVAEKTGYPTDMLDPSMDMEADLGIDSIKRVEIMGALGERFPGHPVPSPEQLGEIRTLDDIVAMLGGSQNENGMVVQAPKAEGAFGIARMPARLLGLPIADQVVDAYSDQPVAVVTGRRDALSEGLVAALRFANWTVHYGSGVPDGLRELDLVIDFAEPESCDVLADALTVAGRTQPLLEAAAARRRATFMTVTRIDGALGLIDPGEGGTMLGGLPGLVKTLAIEAPTLFSRCVDLAPGLTDDRAVELLLAELHDSDTALAQVGIGADGARCTVGVECGSVVGCDLDAAEIAEPGPDDLLVVTGGARGVTAACAIGLAKRFGAGLVLLGRTSLAGAEPDWADGVPLERLKTAIAAELRSGGEKPTPREVERIYRDLAAQREIRATLSAIREAGSAVEYLTVDITDRAGTGRALAGYRDRITGVVHGAGVLADQLIVDKGVEDVRRVLDVKLAGLSHVVDAADTGKLRHVLLFSSVAGFFGNRGQSDYAMANEALNRVAVALRRRMPHIQVTSVNWGAWAGGMVTPGLQRMFEQRGIPLIPLDRGVELFAEQLTAPRSADVVCVIAPETPLSARDTAPSKPERIVVRRDVRAWASEPALADHAIGGAPVLPATAAMGAMLNVVHRALPGRDPVGLRSFSVLKGLVFDGSAPDFLDFELVAGEVTEVLVRDGQGRPRYRAEVVEALDRALRWEGLPPLDVAEPVQVYGEALFHGPLLQGIHRILRDSADDLVLMCRIPAQRFAAGACGSAAYDPMLADLLLQAALVRVHRSTGMRSLPSSVGAIEVHAAIRDDEPFLVVVSEVEVSIPTVRCQVTACTPNGDVLLRMRDVQVVTRAVLDGKFAAADD